METEVRENQGNTSLLYIAPSRKITGMLTLEKAREFEVGLFEDISFQTYVNIVGVTSTYNSDYVILAREKKDSIYFIEPFTGNSLLDKDRPGTRCTHGTTDPYFIGTNAALKPASVENIGGIFPDDEAIEEYKKLFKEFCRETYRAREEYIKILKEQRERAEMYEISNQSSIKEGNGARGAEIVRGLNEHAAKIGEIVKRFLGLDNYTSQVYVTTRNGESEPETGSKIIEKKIHRFY
ncbi:MAG: hypothetical protein IKF82_04730 [Bacilli bacterium]|nr:hypothetical protein [Bacilli bacterium]